jgi:hypothetical protein
MSIIRRINRFFWLPGLSIFDCMCIGIIGSLINTYGWWCALLYLVAITVSVLMQQIFEER